MNLSGRRTLLRAAAPLAALALLTGCGELPPGTAATVNGTRVTVAQVDDLVQANCAGAERATASGQNATMPLNQVRQRSLGLLIDNELNRQFGRARHITPDPNLAAGFFQQFQPGIEPLPEQARSELTQVFGDWARGRAVLIEAGSRATGQKPGGGNMDQLLRAGLQQRTTWLSSAEVVTDPRYGPDEHGFPGGGDGSVSRPVSDFAKKASAAQSDPAWVSSLPAGQKCG